MTIENATQRETIAHIPEIKQISGCSISYCFGRSERTGHSAVVYRLISGDATNAA
jgi:hypothetical protein